MKIDNQVGIIHSPWKTLKNMPIQPKGAKEVIGKVEVFDEFAEGLHDLEGFSHIYLIYLFHKATRVELTVTPFMDTVERGVFATRSPLRPSHFGLSIVELLERKENEIVIRGVDILDQTPLLDIKPYIAAFDKVSESKSGWLTSSDEAVVKARSDDRFV